MNLKLIAALVVAFLLSVAGRAHAAFHLWTITQIYSNSDGSLQFIEMFDPAGSQQFFNGQSITVSNSNNSVQHPFSVPLTPNYSGTNSLNHFLLFGTNNLHAAGGPVPDFIIPNGFLFTGGGKIDFFGTSGGTNDLTYPALPSDSVHALTYNNGPVVINSPTNFSGQTGAVLLPGDFNHDNVLSVADVSAMMSAFADLAAYQKSKGFSQDQMNRLGDVNGDGSTTNADIQALINRLANGAAPAASLSAVPEPSGTFLFICGASLIGMRLLARRRCAKVSKTAGQPSARGKSTALAT
jgi:hypothetical protein